MEMWTLRDAGERFEELVDRACGGEPQIVTRDGEAVAVVLSNEDYRVLTSARPDFKSYLLSGPKVDDFTIPRSSDCGRDVDL